LRGAEHLRTLAHTMERRRGAAAPPGPAGEPWCGALRRPGCGASGPPPPGAGLPV